MFPTILQLGPVTITSLGLFIALGFFIGSFLVWKKTKEEHFDEEKVMDGVIITAIAGLIFSRAFYILFYWYKFKTFFPVFFDLVNKPGFVWLGAFLGGSLALKYLSSKNKWDFFKIADLIVFGTALGSVFFHLGLFLDGDRLAVFEALLMAVILKALYYLDKNYRTYDWYKNKRGEPASGFLFFSFLSLFAFAKLVVVFFKDYGLYWKWFQLGNLLVILTSLASLYFRSGRQLKLFSSFNLERKKRVLAKRSHYKTGMEAKI